MPETIPESLLVHGSCIAIDDVGVLLRGASGAGKSDLALRLLDRGARLVADDQTCLRALEGSLWASAPRPILGLIEVRGMGLMRTPAMAGVALDLVFDLIGQEQVGPEQIERLPEPEYAIFLGLRCRRYALNAREASAAAKVRLAVQLFMGSEAWGVA